MHREIEELVERILAATGSQDPDELYDALLRLKHAENKSGMPSRQGRQLDAPVTESADAILEVFLLARQYERLIEITGVTSLWSHYERFLHEHAADLPTAVLLQVVEKKRVLFDWHGENTRRENESLTTALRRQPGFFRELATRQDPSITPALTALIRQGTAKQKDEGSSFTNHMKTQSAFRFVHWVPSDSNIAEILQVLAVRGTNDVAEFFVEMADTLPWGEDRFSTTILLTLMGEWDRSEFRNAISRGLERYVDLTPVRQSFLNGFFQYAPLEAMRAALEDLSSHAPPSCRHDWLAMIDQMLEEASHSAGRGDGIDAALLQSVQVGHWDSISRGIWARLLKKHFPNAVVSGVSVVDRLTLGLVMSFESCRFDHMGCGCLVVMVSYSGFMFAVSRLCGQGDKLPRLVSLGAFLAWIMVLGFTCRTHFSGHETILQKLWLAVCFWTAMIVCPILIVLMAVSNCFW